MIDHLLLIIFKYIEPSSTVRLRAVISTNVLYIARSRFYPYVFCHAILSNSEHLNGLRLEVNTWADTACAGKHAFMEELVMRNFITEKVFTTALGSLDNFSTASILYAYDAANSEIIILEENNSIYLCDNMNDLLLKPIQ